MKKSSPEDLRQKIIGLGDSSVKKSYYPLLQEKIRELEGKQKQLMSIVRTLEERETELEQLLETKDALLMEVNHRVKNNLQLIGSLLSLGSAGRVSSSETEQFEKTRKRIDTISLIYQNFLFSESYQEVTFCALLRAVAGDIRSETGMSDVELVYDFPVNEIILDIDTAIPLALIANEVIANSFNFAFGSGDGVLRISLRPFDGDGGRKCFRLILLDDGPGFLTEGMKKRQDSFGMTLIDALAVQLGGEFLYENTEKGVVFKFEFDAKAELPVDEL